MMGFRAKTKKEVRELIGQNVSGHFVETSLFGNEYSSIGKFTVCISLDCSKIRKVFGTLTIIDNYLIKVE